jgi:hypothetical protein
VFNCYNSEINIKYILNEIQSYIKEIVENTLGEEGCLTSVFSHKSLEQQIMNISSVLRDRKEFRGKFLLIINNIDGPSFINKLAQRILALMAYTCGFILLATCDNLYLNYFWNQTIKDNYSFYYLRYHTFIDYEVEVSDKNSLVGEKSMKSGIGLSQILQCLTDSQRLMIKKLAEIQLGKDKKKLTLDNLADIMIMEMIATSKDNLRNMIMEPKDHEIIIVKEINGYEYYTLNLEKEILQKLKDGEYDK